MSPARLSDSQRAAVARGWSAADVADDELVDDVWIALNTAPGKAPSKVRAVSGRMLSAVRTIGADPLAGKDPADLSGLLPKLPRPIRRALVQRGGLTRDQMRRIAARTGYPYVEAWSGHNRGSMTGVWGAMVHHTGTPWSVAGDYPTLRVVRDGRSDLANSLCGFGLGRSGTIYLISEKVSWHAGSGEWNGMRDGNGLTYGVEAESDGKNWTDAERDCYPRLIASLLFEIGQDDRYTTRHASYALPRGRKTDASGLNMEAFWNQVYAYLRNPASIHKDYGKLVPVPPPGTATHTVVRGDTLSAIARRYAVTLDQLRTWNGLTGDVIKPGQVLRVAAAPAPAPAGPPPPPPAPAPVPPPVTHFLAAGQVLRAGQALVARNYVAAMQGDGNFVVYQAGRPVWSTRTDRNAGAFLAMQGDGNLVVYNASGRVLWDAGTHGRGGNVLVMQDDGNLVIYRPDGRPVWDRL